MKEQDFSGVKVGDKLWSFELGECEVIELLETKFKAISPLKEWNYYCFNGKSLYRNGFQTQTLFYSKPEFEPPPKPKRMVKKSREVYMNIYEDGSGDFYPSIAEAQDGVAGHIATCVPVTIEWEEEE